MKKTICIILCVMLCMMSLVPLAGAEDGFSDISIKYDRDTGAVNISGKAEFSKNEDEPVRLMVLKPETDVKKFISGDITFMACGVYADEVKLTEKAFTFDPFVIPTTSAAGQYIVRIATDGVVEDTLTIPVASRQQTIDAMNNASSEKVKSNIANYNDVYCFEIGKDSIFASLEPDKQLGVYGSLANRTYEDLAALQLEFKRACLLQKIYQGPWSSVSSIIGADDAKTILGLDTTDYKNNLTTDGQDNVCKALSGNLYDIELLKTTFDELVKAEKAPKRENPGSSDRKDKTGTGVIISTPNTNNNISENTSVSEGVFSDLQNHSWAKASIEELYNKGIINGKSDNLFAPDDLLTRAEAVKIIVLAFFDVNSNAECSFTDVLENNWAYPYVATAYELGVINGYSDNYVGANDNITREDLSVMIARAASLAGVKLNSGEAVEFSDGGDIAAYAKDAVEALSSAGIINGVGNGEFAPKNNATRAQAAKIVAGII